MISSGITLRLSRTLLLLLTFFLRLSSQSCLSIQLTAFMQGFIGRYRCLARNSFDFYDLLLFYNQFWYRTAKIKEIDKLTNHKSKKLMDIIAFTSI